MRPYQGKIILATFPRGVALRKQRAPDSHEPVFHPEIEVSLAETKALGSACNTKSPSYT
jgi:hypothetical protein